MKTASPLQRQFGQGLVEYVLLLALVAMVVIIGLFLVGPALSNLLQNVTQGFSNPATAPAGPTAGPGATVTPNGTAAPGSSPTPSATATPITGVILSASAQRTGGGHGNSLNVTVTVSSATTLSLIDSAGTTRVTNAACSNTCIILVPSIGHGAGYIAIVAAGGGVTTVSYPARP